MPTQSMPPRKASRDKGVPGRYDAVPAIAACFLVRFDQRVGYTIAWQRTIPGLELDSVEFKSLPSGLHNVDEDVVYFDHGRYVGISSFSKSEDAAVERNVSFLAAGALVLRERGDVSQAWRHAAGLQNLSMELSDSRDDMQPLEAYWTTHGADDKRYQSTYRRSKSRSVGEDEESLEGDPELSLTQALDDFGPLIFPLQRAALLRQRLLFVKQPQLRHVCELVQNLSAMTSISSTAAISLQPALSSIHQYFNIGIHDIPMLEQDAAKASDGTPVVHTDDSGESTATGWIACSSDELLATKVTLSDLRVKYPRSDSAQKNARWPEAIRSDGTMLQATQRDLRRYVALRQCLMGIQTETTPESWSRNPDSDRAPLLRSRSRDLSSFEVRVPEESRSIEAQSWALIAYDSYLWWASAGERASNLQEEYDQDVDLFLSGADSSSDANGYTRKTDLPSTGGSNSTGRSAPADLMAYFRRVTVQIMTTLKSIVGAADPQSADARVYVSKEDLLAMGLDPWSQSDRDWTGKMIRLYFGREADVQGGSVECCGVKLY